MGLWSKILGNKIETAQPAQPAPDPAKKPPAPSIAPTRVTSAVEVAPQKTPSASVPRPEPEVSIVQLNRDLHNLPAADLMKAAFMGMAHAYGDQIVKAMENPNLEERVKGVETVEALMPTAVQFLGEYDKATVILRKMLAQATRENAGSSAIAASTATTPTPAPTAPTIGGPRKLTPKNPT